MDLPTPLSWSGLVDQPVCSGDSGVVVASRKAPLPWRGPGPGCPWPATPWWESERIPAPCPRGNMIRRHRLSRVSLLEPITIEAESNGLAVEVSLTQPSCGGALVGEALVSPTGGLPPYDITVEGAADSLFLPFLVPGTYPFALTDSVGCAVGDTITIEPASDFELIADVDSASAPTARMA